jgi:hypothetical protein
MNIEMGLSNYGNIAIANVMCSIKSFGELSIYL